MTKLRLGPIEEHKPVKLTVELPATLVQSLNAYAQVHARETGVERPLSLDRLIPPMLDRFVATDRAFTRARRSI